MCVIWDSTLVGRHPAGPVAERFQKVLQGAPFLVGNKLANDPRKESKEESQESREGFTHQKARADTPFPLCITIDRAGCVTIVQSHHQAVCHGNDAKCEQSQHCSRDGLTVDRPFVGGEGEVASSCCTVVHDDGYSSDEHLPGPDVVDPDRLHGCGEVREPSGRGRCGQRRHGIIDDTPVEFDGRNTDVPVLGSVVPGDSTGLPVSVRTSHLLVRVFHGGSG